MRLLVISHTEHYERGQTVVGWGATVREIDALASLFEELVHVAPLHRVRAPESAIAYRSPRVRFVPVPPAGGARLEDKIRILRTAPSYLRTIFRELRRCDLVHVRCPANISAMAVLLLILTGRPERRWIKYAGSWTSRPGEPWSYAFQRWLLRSTLHRGVVTVNGSWPAQPAHVHSILNPCLTDEELAEGRRAALQKTLGSPVRLLFVGHLSEAKGAWRALEILARVREQGIPAELRMVGEGPDGKELERQAALLSLTSSVRFLGAVPRGRLPTLYAGSDIQLLPSRTEGWPKVLSEGMAYGVVPIASDVGSIPQLLESFQVGRALPAGDIEAFAAAIAGYCENPQRWKAESLRCLQAADRFSYRNYLARVRQLLRIPDEAPSGEDAKIDFS